MTCRPERWWERSALAVGLAVAVALGAVGCGSASDSSAGGESKPWGWEAEAWMGALQEAEEQRIKMPTVFYAADAVYDFSMVGGPGKYAQGRRDVVALQSRSDSAELIRGPLFLDTAGVVRVVTLVYPASWGDDSGPVASLTHLRIGEDGIDRFTHMRGTWYRDRSTGWQTPGAARMAGWVADQVAADYRGAWSAGDADAIYRLYSPEASVTDAIRSVTARGQEAIITLAQQTATPLVAPTLAETVPAEVMDVDPYPDPSTPAVFFAMEASMDGVLSQVWVPVRSKAGCPGAWVAALTVDGDGRVLTEHRFPALDSLRACDDPAELAQGWWTGRDLPFPFGEPVVTSLDTAGGAVEVRNGSPATDTLVTWAFDRFAAADLPAPAVSTISFDPYAERCQSAAGYADWTGGQTSILICLDGTGIGPLRHDPDAITDGDAADLTPVPRRGHLMLHELSHSWLVDHTDQATRQAYLDHVGLDNWNDTRQPWGRRGVEWAAETLAWGLKGTGTSPVNLASPPCQSLTDGFHILTGAEPLTQCPSPDDPQ